MIDKYDLSNDWKSKGSRVRTQSILKLISKFKTDTEATNTSVNLHVNLICI